MDKLRSVLFLLLCYFLSLLFIVHFSFAEYPSFNFNSVSDFSGVVDLTGQVSSGVRLELFANEEFVKSIDLVDKEQVIELDGSSIENIAASYGSSIIFRNIGPRVYKLNVSNVYKELSFGDELVYTVSSFGVINYTDEEEGVEKVISVSDKLIPFNFSDIGDYLRDGENNISFVIKYPFLSYSNEKVYNFTINYEKYSNEIFIQNYSNVTNSKKGFVEGYLKDSSENLYYVLNIDPIGIGNTGAFNKVNLRSDGSFRVNLTNLMEGENKVYFVTVRNGNFNVYTGYKSVKIISDTIPPYIRIERAFFKKDGKENNFAFDGSDIYLNGNSITLVIKSDSVLLNYSLNGENFSKEVKNDSVNLSISLEKGKNILILRAIDRAGNIKKESHNIFFDDSLPDIVKDSLEPKEMFNGGITHFFFQNVKGKTNKPNVEMTVFTIPIGSKKADGTVVSCSDYKNLFLRNLGQMDNPSGSKYSLNTDESQLSLLSLINSKKVVRSDSDGNFKVLISLQERDFTESEYSEAVNNKEKKNPKVSSVRSKNKVCFVLKDKFGNYNIHEEVVTLDSGNTLWRLMDISTMPNTVYAGEIENTGDIRSGSGLSEFGVIARFEYIGSGTVNRITSFRVAKDTEFNSRQLNFDIDNSRTKFIFNKESNEMIVYFAVRIKPLHIDPMNYPDHFDLAFKAYPVYTVEETDVPIDTHNPIYFQTKVNVERPLDHTKWLTPETLKNAISFLNSSINFTRRAVKYTKYATIGGVLACIGYKYYHALESATLGEEEKRESEKMLYQICDRVACSASPKDCTDFNNKNGFVELKEPSDVNSNYYTDESFKDELYFKQGEKIIGGVDKVRFLGKCEFPDKKEGVYVAGVIETYDDEDSGLFIKKVKSTARVSKICVPAEFDSGNPKKVKSVNLNYLGGICFNPNPPYYDQTRCNFFNSENPIKGKDPSRSIISSIQCGCITDTYSHLKKYLEIQEKIRGCLEQARIGNVKGSYCERIMSQAVCDLATNVVIPELFDNSNARKDASGGTDPHGGFKNILTAYKNTEKAFDRRYKGTIFSKTGMSTQELVNKACLWAFTGDFSLLSDNILGAIEENEIEPTFGPPAPESRFLSYNPTTGEISIRYMFTHGVVSGGQSVKTTYKLVCDANAPGGEFCPKGGIFESDQIPGESFKKKVVITPKNGYQSDTVIITDSRARFWYNKLRVVHEYRIKNKKVVTEPVDFLIIHKKESLPVDCHWDAGIMGDKTVSSGITGGLKCDTLFDSDVEASYFSIDKGMSGILPSRKNKFYSSEPIFLKVAYRISNSDTYSDSLKLISLIECSKTSSSDEKIYLKAKDSGSIFFVNNLKSNKKTTIPTGLDVSAFYLLSLPKVEKEDNFDHYRIDCLSGKNIRVVFDNSSQGKIKYIRKVMSDGSVVKPSDYNSISCTNVEYLYIGVKKDEDLSGIKFISFNSYNKIAGADLDKSNNEIIPQKYSLLSPMSCTIYSRVLPEDCISSLTKENFKTFDPNGGSIITNVESSNILELPFSISLNPTNVEKNKVYFDLIYPFEGQFLMFVDNKVSINMNYILWKHSSSENPKYKLNVSLFSETYGDLGNCESNAEVSKNSISSFSCSIRINSDVLKDSKTEDSWLKAGNSGLPIILKYNLKKGNKILKSGAVKVYLKKGKLLDNSLKKVKFTSC